MTPLKWTFLAALVLVLAACNDDINYRSGTDVTDDQTCGDGTCEGDEDNANCPDDCRPTPEPDFDPGMPPPNACGDGVCTDIESPLTCPQDCGDTPPPPNECGDGVCEPDESPRNCPQDCGDEPPPNACGDGICGRGENPNNCPQDCEDAPPPPNVLCGDGICEPGEDPRVCSADCPRVECVPFVSVPDNGCVLEDQQTCVAITDGEGLCFTSGDRLEETECEIINGSAVGDCVGSSLCLPRDGGLSGVCERMCEAWADPDELSNCDDNEVCGLLSDGVIGVCSDEVDPNRPPPLQPCELLGGWCGPETLCIQVDQQGNGACVQVCRLNLGNEDCSGDTNCDELLDSPLLGLCVP